MRKNFRRILSSATSIILLINILCVSFPSRIMAAVDLLNETFTYANQSSVPGWTCSGVSLVSNRIKFQTAGGGSIKRTVSTVGYGDIQVSYKRWTTNPLSGGDSSLKLFWSGDSGSTWMLLETVNVTRQFTETKTFVIPNTSSAGNNPNFMVKLEATGSTLSSANCFLIDDIIVRGTLSTPTVTSIDIAGSDQLTLLESGTAQSQYNASVKDQNGLNMTGQTVSWAVYDSLGTIVPEVTINSSGLLSAQSTTVPGVFTIKAVSDTNPAISSTKSVTILSSARIPTSIEITGSGALSIPSSGSITSQYTAVVKDQNNVAMSGETVLWAVYSSAYAHVAGLSISQTGLLTVQSGISSGDYVIKAVAAIEPGTYSTKAINLTATPGGFLVAEDFSTDASRFTPVLGGTWSVSNGKYMLSTPASGTILGNISLHNTPIMGNFSLSALCNVVPTTNAWNDFELVFGYQDSNNYYMASFNESNNDGSNGIIKVHNGLAVEIFNFSQGITGGVDYAVDVVRYGNYIAVKLNGQQIAIVEDTTFMNGQVGVASKNDACYFDNFEVKVDFAPLLIPAPTTIMINGLPSFTINQAASINGQYTAVVKDQLGFSMPQEAVLWAVYNLSNELITSLSISEAGVLNIDSSAAAGLYKVKAVSTKNPSIYQEKVITLVQPLQPQTAQAGPVWPQELIDEIISAGLVKFDPTNGAASVWPNDILRTAEAMYTLALSSYHNPNIKSTSGIQVGDRLLEQIRHMIDGGNEPACRGGISGWVDNQAAMTLALAKKTPSIWNSLSTAEKEKCDWLMKFLMATGNYTQNFDNDPKIDLSGVTANINKGWNPNIQEGYVGVMIAAYLYYDGAQNVNTHLAQFNYDNYMSKLDEYGWTNIKTLWSGMNKILMENGGTDAGGGVLAGVRQPFTFKDYGQAGTRIPYETFAIYKSLATRMYWAKNGSERLDGSGNRRGYMQNGVVYDNSGNAKGYIIDGTKSPYMDQVGACYEFLTDDAYGVRSSAHYVYDGLRNNIITAATLKAMGLWDVNDSDVSKQMHVGVEDFLYKVKHGYNGWKNGEVQILNGESSLGMGYSIVKQVWYRAVKEQTDSNISIFGEGSITVPLAGSTNASYSAGIIDQDGESVLGRNVNWSVLDATYQPVVGASINVSGILTIDNRIMPGKYKIKAESTTNSAVYAYKEIVVDVAVDTTAPSVPVLSEAGKTATTVSISWTAATDNVGVTGYEVYQGTTSLGAVTDTVYAVTGLTPATAYTFRVVAKDAAGNEAGSNELTITTDAEAPPEDTTVPQWPTGASITVSEVGKTSMVLTWMAATDNVEVTGYKLFINESSEPHVVLDSTTHTCRVTDLTKDTEYSFTVKAYNAKGNESAALRKTQKTDKDATTTIPADPITPGQPATPAVPAKYGENKPQLDPKTGEAKLKIEIPADAFEKVKETVAGDKVVTTEIPKVEGAKSYTAVLPVDVVTSDKVNQKVELKTEFAIVTIPGNMLKNKDVGNAVRRVAPQVQVGNLNKTRQPLWAELFC